MINTLLERLWSSETKTPRASHFKVSAAIAAAVLAAAVVVLATATRPAEAAFPGASGAIAFTSGATVSSLDVWRMAPDGFGATKLTESTAIDANPSWQPMP